MKRLITVAMSGLMALSLTACGGSAQEPAAAKPETQAEQAGGSAGDDKSGGSTAEGGDAAGASGNVLEGKKVGFSQTDSMSSWRTTETDSIKEYIEGAGGEFIVKDAGGDIATQESDIRDLVAAGVDFLVVAPSGRAPGSHGLGDSRHPG